MKHQHSSQVDGTRKPYSGLTRSLVIAIDVGTTFSGVSYAILEPGEIPKIHGVTRFPGQEHVAGNSKIPSVIYYDKHGKMMAAGAEADTSSVLTQAEDEGWIKAELFKLRLRPRTMALNMNGMRLGPLPKRKSPVHVFGDFLAYLYRCTRNFITDTHANGSALWNAVEHDVQFVLSHPNGWEGAQQSKMRRAAVYGGLIPDTNEGKARIRFVTEGEASLHACVLSGLAADVLSNPSKHGFLIADAGGGTLDISAYAIRGTSPLVMEEIAPPDCIFAGSVFVSRRAREFLEEKLKNSKYGTPDAVDHITRRFDETTKRLFRNRQDLQFIPFGSPLDKDLAVGIRGGQLKLTGNEVANLFEPSVDAAFNAIKAQIEASQGIIKSVFLVGGYAASPWLFNQLQERLAPFRVTVSRPDTQTSKAVADGAIGFYCDHHVSARMSKFMYGVEFLRELNPSDPDHVSRKARLCELPSGPKLLPDAFDCILARGVKVKESTVFSRKYCTELTNLSMLSVFEVEIWCYRGGNTVPKWINRHADDFSTLCVVRADLSPLSGSAEPKTSRNGKTYWTIVFSVEIHFGLTEFKARIKWVDNGATKYGPASIVYNERGHRVEEDEPDVYPEDDVVSASSRDRDRDRGSRLRSEPVSRTRSPEAVSRRPSIRETTPTPSSAYSNSIPVVARVERTASKHSTASLSESERKRGLDKGKDRDRDVSYSSSPMDRTRSIGGGSAKIGDALSQVWDMGAAVGAATSGVGSPFAPPPAATPGVPGSTYSSHGVSPSARGSSPYMSARSPSAHAGNSPYMPPSAHAPASPSVPAVLRSNSNSSFVPPAASPVIPPAPSAAVLSRTPSLNNPVVIDAPAKSPSAEFGWGDPSGDRQRSVIGGSPMGMDRQKSISGGSPLGVDRQKSISGGSPSGVDRQKSIGGSPSQTLWDAPKSATGDAPKSPYGNPRSVAGDAPKSPYGNPRSVAGDPPASSWDAPKSAVGDAPKSPSGWGAPKSSAGDTPKSSSGWGAPKSSFGDASKSPSGWGAPKSPFGDASKSPSGWGAVADAPKSPVQVAAALTAEAPKSPWDPPKSAVGDAPKSPWDAPKSESAEKSLFDEPPKPEAISRAISNDSSKGLLDASTSSSPTAKGKKKKKGAAETEVSPVVGTSTGDTAAAAEDTLFPAASGASPVSGLGLLGAKSTSPNKALSPLNPASQAQTPAVEQKDPWDINFSADNHTGADHSAGAGTDLWGTNPAPAHDPLALDSILTDPASLSKPKTPAVITQDIAEEPELSAPVTPITPGGKNKKKKKGANGAAEAAKEKEEKEKKDREEKERKEQEDRELERELEETLKRQQEEKDQEEAKQKADKEKKDKEEQEAREREEEDRKKEDERKHKEEEERKHKEEEERKHKEEEDRKHKEEEDRKHKEEEDRKHKEEEDRKHKEEEDRKHKEAEEKEKAEKEEKERKEKETPNYLSFDTGPTSFGDSLDWDNNGTGIGDATGDDGWGFTTTVKTKKGKKKGSAATTPKATGWDATPPATTPSKTGGMSFNWGGAIGASPNLGTSGLPESTDPVDPPVASPKPLQSPALQDINLDEKPTELPTDQEVKALSRAPTPTPATPADELDVTSPAGDDGDGDKAGAEDGEEKDENEVAAEDEWGIQVKTKKKKKGKSGATANDDEAAPTTPSAEPASGGGGGGGGKKKKKKK